MTPLDGLTPYERFVWRAWIKAARAWAQTPSRGHAVEVSRWTRLAFKTPVPQPREKAVMRAVLDGLNAARGFKDQENAERVAAWPMLAAAIDHLETSLSNPEQLAVETGPARLPYVD